ncbi:uncharacterized protein LOC118562653 [Fundulus heteroclitus]|uniref:uncharacterized protein LOC118562653 n=1 Tax=Fundulus heteroclitus TaxID=8078 RepID=UPI00165B24EF|nr:uncharacterized protein LOC118562653 [Fundulus heteroclitus]
MTSSPRNACVCVFFLTYWNSCILPGNAAALQLRSWLGCPVLVPGCSADSDSFSWFYKENERSKETRLYLQDKTGIKRFGNTLKGDVLANRSLFFSKFTEKDEGIYWCQNCHQDSCKSTSIINVQREIMDEIQKTIYILSGSYFTQTCPGEFSTFKWTFEASNKTQNKLERRSEAVTVTTNKSLYTGPVQNTDAGYYTCWASRCDGPSQKVLTINLCVITVYQRLDSPLSCAATCDVDLNDLTDSSSLLISNRTLSVDRDPSGSLICNLSEILDEHLTTTNSYTSSVALSPTMGGYFSFTDFNMFVGTPVEHG